MAVILIPFSSPIVHRRFDARLATMQAICMTSLKCTTLQVPSPVDGSLSYSAVYKSLVRDSEKDRRGNQEKRPRQENLPRERVKGRKIKIKKQGVRRTCVLVLFTSSPWFSRLWYFYFSLSACFCPFSVSDNRKEDLSLACVFSA